MYKKIINIAMKLFQEGKKLFIHCLMVRIYTETHCHGCVSFDKIRDIIGERIYDGVFAPGFFDYLRLAALFAVTAFRPDKWHRSVILDQPVKPAKKE